MDKQKIFEQVQSALVQLFELPEESIKPESKLFEELDLDSIDAVDLVVHLQKKIGKKVDPETFKSVRTVQDVVEAVYNLMNNH
jgi:acyl carrier protein